MTIGKDGANIHLNIESFAFLESSRLQNFQARITALALPDRTSNSSFGLLSLVNATPRYLNFTRFNDAQPTCREHWAEFLERCNNAIVEVLIFILTMSYAAAKSLNAFWRRDSENKDAFQQSKLSLQQTLILKSINERCFNLPNNELDEAAKDVEANDLKIAKHKQLK